MTFVENIRTVAFILKYKRLSLRGSHASITKGREISGRDRECVRDRHSLLYERQRHSLLCEREREEKREGENERGRERDRPRENA